MKAVLSVEQGLSLGSKVRRLRVSQLLTQEELANMAGVSLEELDLLEQNMPVQLGVRCKVLKELWAERREYQTSFWLGDNNL